MKKSYADMDPLEEIRAIRAAISNEFKTVSAYGEYLRDKYPGANAKTEASATGKPGRKAAGQRKTGKRMAHT